MRSGIQFPVTSMMISQSQVSQLCLSRLESVAYNNGDSFEISPTSIYGGNDSGDDIELIYIAFNGSASSFSTSTAVGISGMMVDPVGSSAADPNSDFLQYEDNPALTPFGVGGVPEPTTLALAGLGGLSMLFRRRKA